MKSGYWLRQMTQRDSLPELALGYHPGVPQQLPAAQQGPPVNERFPLERYLEDNEFVATLGDLDPFNGRTTVTPEFPNRAVTRGPAGAVSAEARTTSTMASSRARNGNRRVGSIGRPADHMAWRSTGRSAGTRRRRDNGVDGARELQ